MSSISEIQCPKLGKRYNLNSSKFNNIAGNHLPYFEKIECSPDDQYSDLCISVTFSYDGAKDTLLLSKAADADFILKGHLKKEDITATLIVDNESGEMEESSVRITKLIHIE